MARVWSEVSLSPRQVGRVVEAIGTELVEERDAEVDDFLHHRRQPGGVDPGHELAAVFVDGGRVQTRDDTPGQGPGVRQRRWREDKIARLQTMTGMSYAVDPCPEPPACFLDTRKLEQFLDPENEPEKPASAAAATEAAEAKPRWQPEPLTRTCVATVRSIDDFRWMVLAEAKRRHFFTAKRRAFVADGQACNWTLHAGQFSDFVPILDFLHAAGYLYAAAKAWEPANPGERYRRWVRACWQGQANEVLMELQTKSTHLGIGANVLPDDHAWRPLQRTQTYLTNHQDKMNYPDYRRQGLPTTSSLIESQIKEFNARVKGSEKFWNPNNAEALLQVIAWGLRDDEHTLRERLEARPGCAFRRRSRKTINPEPKCSVT